MINDEDSTQDVSTTSPLGGAAGAYLHEEVLRILRSSRQEAPTPLYHYTSTDGLLGIVETRKFWASSIYQLNDLQEGYWSLTLIEEVAKRLSQNEKSLSGLISAIPMMLREILPDLAICVASFSASGDTLSQWRAYAPGQPGICIGFDLTAVSSREFHLSQCEYNKAEQDRILTHLILETARRHARSGADVTTPDGCFAFARGLVAMIGALLPRFKNPGFAEEEEWRLVSQPLPPTTMKFRSGRWGIVPYQEIELASITSKLPITEVTVAPGPQADRVIHGLRLLFAANGLQRVGVRASEIPFRQD